MKKKIVSGKINRKKDKEEVVLKKTTESKLSLGFKKCLKDFTNLYNSILELFFLLHWIIRWMLIVIPFFMALIIVVLLIVIFKYYEFTLFL